MKPIKISFEISQKSASILMALLILIAIAQRIYSENVTITTSYPSPSGIYSKIISTGDTWLAREGGKLMIGTGSNASRPVEMQLHRENDNAAFRITSPSSKNSAIQLYDYPSQTGWALLKGGSAGGPGNLYIREDTVENQGVIPAAISILRESRNVGIGTENPLVKLDVVGSIRIKDGSEGANKVLTSNADGVANWQAPSGGTTLTYYDCVEYEIGAGGGWRCGSTRVVKDVSTNGGDWGGGDFVRCCRVRIE